MTDRERAIVMAYTGVVMLSGDKMNVFYEYVSEKLGRPVWTHEFATKSDMIKELAKEDFISLCAGKPLPKPRSDSFEKIEGNLTCIDDNEVPYE